MLQYLKVKSKTLAEEAKIIRLEEKKAKARRRALVLKGANAKAKLACDLRYGLHEHRVNKVRPEARATHLAYGFLRKTPYLAIENFCRTQPDWESVAKMISRYGQMNMTVDDIKAMLEEWRESTPVAA